MNLNLGCGPVKMDGWVNVDFDESVRPDMVADIRHLPLEDGVADRIFASHVLEHFGWEEPVLEEWHRVLKSGGEIVIIVPDVVGVYRQFREGGGWWGQPPKPIDLAYVNATVFGAHLLGPEWIDKSHTHKQIFIEDMLVERLRPLFPDVREIPARSMGERAAMGRKP